MFLAEKQLSVTGRFDADKILESDGNVKFKAVEIQLKFGPQTSLSFSIQFEVQDPLIALTGKPI